MNDYERLSESQAWLLAKTFLGGAFTLLLLWIIISMVFAIG